MTARTVMCFGDSLTWGWKPVAGGAAAERYRPHERWTGILAQGLGPRATVIEEGLSARVAAGPDPTDERLFAQDHLPSLLASHLPLDLVIVMLGTNDTKAYLERTPVQIAAGVSTLLGQIAGSAGGVGTSYPAPGVLLVSPPPLAPMPHPWFAQIFAGGREKTLALPQLYQAMADFFSVSFFDAGTVTATGGVDGIHFSEANNRELGEALVPVVGDLLERG